MPKEKLILQLICKYGEMVNAQLADALYRLKVLEAALQKNPQLLEAYNQAVKDTQRGSLPGLPRQLQAVQQEVDRLPG